MVMAVVLSALVLLGWTVISDRYFPQPQSQVVRPAVTASTTVSPEIAPNGTTSTGTTPVAGGAVPGIAPVATVADRGRVLAASPRLAIVTPRLQGSINLRGARFDDLVLPTYRETIDKASPPVRLLSPSGTKDAYFGQFGWTGAGAPPSDALWTASAPRLTPQAPVTLSWTSPAGAVFEQVIAVDQDFMFTVRQRVRNTGATPLTVQPWGLVSRLGTGPDANSYNMHVGPVAVIDGTLRDSDLNYDTLREDGPKRFSTTGGWIGITDNHWLAAMIPDQARKIDARFAASSGDQYQADFLGAGVIVPAGGTQESTARFFAGAKEIKLLDRYMTSLNIPHFDLAVSWGWFIIIAQPIFYLLDWLFRLTNNFGVAIIGLTIIVRAALFPIANKQYESMAKMRIVGPKMKAIQERYKDDKVRQQQEVMNLYKTEKVNPIAGCLPLVLQIPIFYALYKTLMVSIEMRHQPFVLWLRDLSAPDPLTPLNLFGAIDWQPPAMIALGVLPILLGVTMWLQQKMNPTPMDPVQKQVFAIMPWMFMFIMAPFAAGLQLYWTTNNIISIGQQWWMLKKFPMPATPPEPITVTPTAKTVGPKPRPAGPKTPNKAAK
ncbi:MAG: membrane protein insertase YidC [Alphaproteobacteria bacterium]|nr:MAG: membrane protein insertase YidC [Alphaproteobacteria bacterium]